MLKKYLTITIVFLTLGFSFLPAYDPFNALKFVVLISSAFGFLLFIYPKINFKQDYVLGLLCVLTIVFTLWGSAASLKSDYPFVESLFGFPGRNIGLLSICALFVYSIIFYVIPRNLKFLVIFDSLKICGLLSLLYGTMQVLDLDIFNWENAEGGIQSFFGNQNLYSAFLGFFGIFIFANTIFKLNIIPKYFSFSFLPLILFLIFETKSIQGFFMMTSGVLILLLGQLHRRRFSKFYYIASYSIVFSIGIGILIDLLQKSPWAPVFYQWTVSQRGYFYEAAIELISENLMFGTGFGSFDNQYKIYRDIGSRELPGFLANTDTSHALILDIGIGGGLPLLIIYLIFTVLVGQCALRIMLNKNRNSIYPLLLAGMWIPIQLHNLISQPSLAIGIWSFLLGGAILNENSDNLQKSVVFTKISMKDSWSPKSKLSLYGVIIGTSIGFMVSIPLFVVDTKVAYAIRNANISQLVSLSESFPKHSSRCAFISQTLRINGFEAQGLNVAKECLQMNKDQISAWIEIVENSRSSSKMKTKAENSLYRLDPLGHAATRK